MQTRQTAIGRFVPRGVRPLAHFDFRFDAAGLSPGLSSVIQVTVAWAWPG